MEEEKEAVFTFDEHSLNQLFEKLEEARIDLGHSTEQFAVMLSMASHLLLEANGITVKTTEKRETNEKL